MEPGFVGSASKWSAAGTLVLCLCLGLVGCARPDETTSTALAGGAHPR